MRDRPGPRDTDDWTGADAARRPPGARPRGAARGPPASAAAPADMTYHAGRGMVPRRDPARQQEEPSCTRS